jgi:hypothetical protein
MTQLRIAQHGSAMFEFLMVMAVLLPVGFGAAMLGKLTDLQQKTELASRYSVWEATVYSQNKLSRQSSATVDRRLYQDQNGAIISEEEQMSAAASEHPLWGPTAGGTSDLRQLANVSRVANAPVVPDYTFDTGRASVAAATGQIVNLAGKPLSGFSGNSWGLVADGLLRSDIGVAVKPTGLLHALQGQCIKDKDSDVTGAPTTDGSSDDSSGDENAGDHVCIRSSGVILADGWSASDDAQTISRVRSLVPSSVLSSVGQGVGSLLGATVFPELAPLDDAFGYVDMSALPEYAKP